MEVLIPVVGDQVDLIAPGSLGLGFGIIKYLIHHGGRVGGIAGRDAAYADIEQVGAVNGVDVLVVGQETIEVVRGIGIQGIEGQGAFIGGHKVDITGDAVLIVERPRAEEQQVAGPLGGVAARTVIEHLHIITNGRGVGVTAGKFIVYLPAGD